MSFEIENGVLKRYTGLEAVITVPDGVTAIDWFAFRERDGISEITLPESVTVVGRYAFSGCRRLEKVNILCRVTLERGAFYNCENLKTLNVPKGIGECMADVFLGCPKLQCDALSDKTFSMYTHTGDSKLCAENLSKQLYSFEDYKRISAEILEYELVKITDACNELEGPPEPTISESVVPFSEDELVVKDGHFVACVLKCEVYRKRFSDILRPGDESLAVEVISGDNMPFYAYSRVTAVLRPRTA